MARITAFTNLTLDGVYQAPGGNQPGNPFSDFFRSTRKHVVTRQTGYQATWENSRVLDGDTDAALTDLHRNNSKDLLVFGSGELVVTLAELGLVDRYVLLLHPLVLGSGKRFGAGLADKRALTLEEVRSTKSGVLLLTYAPAP